MKLRNVLVLLLIVASSVAAQKQEPKAKVRTVTIPISIFTKQELKEKRADEFVRADQLIVREDKEDQQILSIRSVGNAPLSIAILIQEDLSSTFNLQLKEIKQFIMSLPPGTRVMVAYLRSGSMDTRQRFTDNLEMAANSLRIVTSAASLAPRSPYDGVVQVLNRFEGVPTGRRAILLFSDGLDTSEGLSLASVSQSYDLDQAILKAQRRGVAVYSFYSPTVITENQGNRFVAVAQGALQKLSDETGGRSFSQGSIAPLSYMPFFRELVLALTRQFSLTYMSTHMQKGYHRVDVLSTNPEIKIDHPKGYNYR